MKKAKTPRGLIQDATKALREIMQSGLSEIAENMIDQIISRASRLIPSQQLNAIKDLSYLGKQAYRDMLLTGLSIINNDALEMAYKELPKAKNIKLADDFNSLSAKSKKRIKTRAELLVESQIADIEKNISFQYTSSVGSTDSISLLREDLVNVADDYITGASVYSAASASASQTINEIRKEWFEDPEVNDQIEAYEFVNGDPVSPICTDLAGTVFSKDDPNLNRYWPPLHWNCKSYIRPIPTGKLGNREITKIKPSTMKAENSIQFSECTCGCNKLT